MQAGPVLTVGVAPTLALHWLIPRLTGFNRNHPNIEVRVATGGATLPLNDDWTCTVRRGAGSWTGYIAEELFPSTLVPVCTPAIAAGLLRPRDLHTATLIVVSHLRKQWTWWFEAAGLSAQIEPSNEVSFESSVMAIQAVLGGVGVAVAQLPYVSDALVAGRLVTPFPIVDRKYEGWYLAYRPIREKDPALLAFRNWLHGEAELQRQLHKTLGLTVT
jgi:LysR family glycine cleavage system transcriptional activator/LysR family transcriptional regulator of beta-lactamase